MSARFPKLETADLPAASEDETKNTASPARGAAMKQQILSKLRVPEFRFIWQFWAERGAAPTTGTSKETSTASENYASRPKPLGDAIRSIKDFYEYFNNMPTATLRNRDSIHLFHLGVRPLWEDPRNARGGAWYFRMKQDVAATFWHEVCLLAVGDVLQNAVETKRESFNDDICGVSYSMRFRMVQVAVWNRDADNEAGKQKLLATLVDNLSPECRPREGSYWYKRHAEHRGFIATAVGAAAPAEAKDAPAAKDGSAAKQDEGDGPAAE